MVACNSECIETESVADKCTHSVSIEQAIRNANTFLNSPENKMQTSSYYRKVNNVIVIKSQNNDETRAGVETSDVLYAINYSDDNGFILASADDRLPSILAYIEDGVYNEKDIQDNPGINMFIKKLIYKYEHNDSSLFSAKNNTTRANYVNEYIHPKMLTKWGYSYPFSLYMSSTYTGSIAPALAQICAYYSKPDSISFVFTNDSIFFDWGGIMQDSQQSGYTTISSSTYYNPIAKLYKILSSDIAMESKYLSSFVPSKMASLGFETEVMMSYDSHKSLIKNALVNSRLIYIRGSESFEDMYDMFSPGIGWAIDGYWKYEGSTYYHCNWGRYGAMNGFYLDNVFDCSNPHELDVPGTAASPGDYYPQYDLYFTTIGYNNN